MGAVNGLHWKTRIFRNIAWDPLEQIHQDCIQEVIRNPKRAFLIASEPEPTFTQGRSAKESDLLWNTEIRKHFAVNTRRVGRGGRWTYHGPGQVVIYPIVHLEALGYSSRSLFAFAKALRQTIQDSLSTFTPPLLARDVPFGLYSQNGEKVASFGLAVQNRVVCHGAAIYLEDQGSYFTGIQPCGVANQRIGSLRALGYKHDWETCALELTTRLKKGLWNHPQTRVH